MLVQNVDSHAGGMGGTGSGVNMGPREDGFAIQCQISRLATIDKSDITKRTSNSV